MPWETGESWDNLKSDCAWLRPKIAPEIVEEEIARHLLARQQVVMEETVADIFRLSSPEASGA